MDLKKIGGTELKNVVYNLLPKILTNEMAEKNSWFEAKGKRALICSNLSGLLKGPTSPKDSNPTGILFPSVRTILYLRDERPEPSTSFFLVDRRPSWKWFYRDCFSTAALSNNNL